MKLKPELRISLRYNPVNTTTIRPKKIGRSNEGVITRKCMAVFLKQPKKVALARGVL